MFMKEFDYELAKEIGVSDERIALYKSIQNRNISVEYFIIAVKRLPKKIGSKFHSPYHLKREYKNLKENFGFFGGIK